MVRRELAWFLPALVITALTFAAAIALAPFARMQGAVRLGFFPLWLEMIAVCIGLGVMARVVVSQRRGDPHPLRALAAQIYSPRFIFLVLGLVLAGLQLTAYILVKSELNFITPFWADSALNRADRIIFGNLPKYLMAINSPLSAVCYQVIWLAALLLTLTYVLSQVDSRSRNTAIISYFLLWSLFGLVGQALLPSAGPIFNSHVGLSETVRPTGYAQVASTYLWVAFESRRFAVASGISAMPSLHIATMVWSVLCLVAFKSKASLAVAALALWMWAASVALGWHYAVDGLVGGLMAVASFWLVHIAQSRRGQCNV